MNTVKSGDGEKMQITGLGQGGLKEKIEKLCKESRAIELY